MWSFLIAVALIAVVVAILYVVWRRSVLREIAQGAEIEWQRFQDNEPEFLKDMSKAQFEKVYRRVNYPRFPDYALLALAAFVVSLPVTFAILSLFAFMAEVMGLSPQPAEIANYLLIEDGAMRFVRSAPPEAAVYYARDLSGFYYFFGVLIAWILIVLGFTRHYHGNRPGYLRDEIIRERQ